MEFVNKTAFLLKVEWSLSIKQHFYWFIY